MGFFVLFLFFLSHITPKPSRIRASKYLTNPEFKGKNTRFISGYVHFLKSMTLSPRNQRKPIRAERISSKYKSDVVSVAQVTFSEEDRGVRGTSHIV